ncbi:amino acid/amide ABC transporter membrane protein 1, HAAT family [Azospirillum sp. RU38E]|nr:amino acid/amide ABC transporter membrane protein 1, HAAT family [Azospirillum sp. RU38E]SNT13676.1 amino acid/amide ABC transporter membrane protein 1, HAAT family [Azospirillum sp. RU37A]
MRMLLFLLSLLLTPMSWAQATPPLIDALATDDYAAKEQALTSLTETGDPSIVPALKALEGGTLYRRLADDKVVIGREDGDSITLTDPLSGAVLGTEPAGNLELIRVNNRLRRAIGASLGALTLRSPDAAVRQTAADAVFVSRDASALPLLDAALADEKDAKVKRSLEQARAAILLGDETLSTVGKLSAIATIADKGGQAALALLNPLTGSEDAAVAKAATEAVRLIENKLAWAAAAQNIIYGLSLGSVLLLAAIGLAVTFGVMGVINMAHGEMVMLGAYTTYVVQEMIRTHAPGLFDWSLLIALPLAFIVAGGVGILIERGIIRFLYGRPLETLLATWGLSLVLQQAVRSIFGPTNMEVGNPTWMAGAFQVGEVTITYGRMWIFLFGLMAFAALMLLLRRTPLGLQMRAVTQNRAMARAMGIRTARVDALTFGLGSGIAGLAGVALSQIDNVSPNLGQGYIIDSFMIVIFGGVGNLWGTLVGAMSLGIVNKLLEPMAGAVLGKILVLVGIILFIQARPRGLFALKGRAIEH